MSADTIEVIVTPHEPFHAELYQAHHNGSLLCNGVPEVLLDLIPYIAARRLLDWGYDLEAMFIVKLRGSDAIMIRAPFGAVAATPIPNTANPIKHPSYNAWLEFTGEVP